jgi:anthranilate/para-aminobenzoate synthase component II
MKGVKDDFEFVVNETFLSLDDTLTIVRHKVYKVSKSVFKAVIVSSGPPSPFKRARLKRMYQLVSSSMSNNSRGTTVYRRYAQEYHQR